jgi:hypothetical protein
MRKMKSIPWFIRPDGAPIDTARRADEKFQIQKFILYLILEMVRLYCPTSSLLDVVFRPSCGGVQASLPVRFSYLPGSHSTVLSPCSRHAGGVFRKRDALWPICHADKLYI